MEFDSWYWNFRKAERPAMPCRRRQMARLMADVGPHASQTLCSRCPVRPAWGATQDSNRTARLAPNIFPAIAAIAVDTQQHLGYASLRGPPLLHLVGVSLPEIPSRTHPASAPLGRRFSPEPTQNRFRCRPRGLRGVMRKPEIQPKHCIQTAKDAKHAEKPPVFPILESGNRRGIWKILDSRVSRIF